MLVERKGERLEVEDTSDTEEAIDPDTERMRGELGVEARGEAAKAMGVLTTSGRRTGRAHTVPVFYLRDGDRLIICNVNPGFERPNPWPLILRANSVVWVQVGVQHATYRAREATEEEVTRYWPQLVRI